MTISWLLPAIAVALLASLAHGHAAAALPGFRGGAPYREQVRWDTTEDGVRIFLDAPEAWDAGKPALVIVYATPNGNTLEQTLGCRPAPGLDRHFSIQQIAAQTRLLRTLDPGRNIALVVVQPEEKSWPVWRRTHPGNAVRIRAIVETVAAQFPAASRKIALAAHSGGGSFIWGFLNGGESVRPEVERIALLDANYSYADEDRHGDKMLSWLYADTTRHLAVLAYDDRGITVDGKLVVGADGGTYRATHRMLARFERAVGFDHRVSGDLETWSALGGQARFIVDRNPRNEILHTVLVETNGFLEAMTVGTPQAGTWGGYRKARVYDRFIQPSPFVEP